MIDEKSFSKEWIVELRSKEGLKKSHPELMEKMIYALYLVEMLAAEGLDFTFKGGTCLTLLIPEVSRFSIDVDITTKLEKEPLEELLTNVIKNSRFSKFELDERRSFINAFPKAHYDIFYNSEYDKTENSILLDVIFDDSPYSEIIEVPVHNNFLVTDNENLNVSVPSLNSITGDKLTAFAPNTIGIPYNKGKDLQIIKQLYDVSRLCTLVDNMETVKTNFEKVSDAQFKYLGKSLTYDKVLQDTIDTALLLATQKKNIGESITKFGELHSGIGKFPSYLPNPRYSMFSAIEDTARSALLAAKLKAKNFEPFPTIDMIDFNPKDFPIVGDKYSSLDKMIRGMPNLSVFYWHHTSRILEELKT